METSEIVKFNVNVDKDIPAFPIEIKQYPDGGVGILVRSLPMLELHYFGWNNLWITDKNKLVLTFTDWLGRTIDKYEIKPINLLPIANINTAVESMKVSTIPYVKFDATLLQNNTITNGQAFTLSKTLAIRIEDEAVNFEFIRPGSEDKHFPLTKIRYSQDAKEREKAKEMAKESALVENAIKSLLEE